ncbi:hypothetical protein BDY19DRAFT_690964 [Irpex rosettiformis]|uniref:Uncharacterized protein n=1 Tax=Irpex rosettiformis TaxID=378272 RepID=A0ACB8UAF2_9APHY|nr:hypothetical protein BDY19DRAFT_690964 [Irpex rosettiformis]
MTKEHGYVAELFDFCSAQRTAIDLSVLLGRERWFANVFRENAKDSKCKLINYAVHALPLVVPNLGDDVAALIRSPSARRQHPRLQELRGRSFDFFPPVYYPPTLNADERTIQLLFLVPAIGYYFRAALYGPSSLHSDRVHGNANGIKWDAKTEGITPHNLAFMFTVLRFHVSGEDEFVQRDSGSSADHSHDGSDASNDKVDWTEEYNRLYQMFKEKWELRGMQQIANAVAAVAFHGANAGDAIRASEGQEAMRSMAERNMQALAAFGTASVISADIPALTHFEVRQSPLICHPGCPFGRGRSCTCSN